MQNVSRRDRLLLSGILITIFCIGLLYTYFKPYHEAAVAQQPSKSVADKSTKITPTQDQVVYIKVDIKGAVNHPGVYTLPSQSRVADGIQAAGGFSASANVNSVNLAAVILDGNQIVVPSIQTTQGATDTNQSGSKLDLNTATEAQLDALPGIGPTRAKQIVQYRETHGLYQSVQDLLNLDGFGPKLFDKIKDQVTVQ